MKITDNKPHLFTLRLTDTQYNFIQKCADKSSLTCGEWLRLLIDNLYYANILEEDDTL